jgi:hypothetical protein
LQQIIFINIIYVLKLNNLQPDGSIVSNFFDSVKSTTGDKQDVLCIYLNKFWSVLTSSLGGTLTTVPSNNFNKACCTSPETSRVIDGLFTGDFVYFINKTIPLSALATS